MKNDFILLQNIDVTYYYGGFAKVDESVLPMSEQRDFPSPAVSLFSKLYLVTEGHYKAVLNGKPCTVKAGDLILIPSGVVFQFDGAPCKKFKQYWVHFNMSVASKNTDFLMGFQTDYMFNVKPKSELKNICSLFDELNAAAADNSQLSKFTTKAILMFLISYCLKRLHAVDKSSNASIVKLVNAYVYNNLQERITVAELAEHFNIGEPYFIRLFKKETGLTPLQYIINKKFEIVRGLLDNTNLPIHNIMYQVGFIDANSFSRAFKKYAGCSPSEYREKSKLTKNAPFPPKS